LGEKQIVLYGEDAIFEKVGEFTFRISSNSFFQTNTRQAERLYGLILDLAELTGKEKVWDLYCGTGAISAFLSKSASRVVGVESMQNTISNAIENAELNQIKNCEFICSDVKEFLKESINKKENIELVVLDPPRAGLHPKAIKYLLQLGVSRIIYVSCNPATLSRDLKFFLDNGYDLKRVCPVDMFPHTFHIESVVLMEKKN
jgi:23S rRNA (uracil1939-C5)-methyltransferase